MKSMLNVIIAVAIIGFVTGAAVADISITSLSQGYSQNFNTLPTQDAGTFTWEDNTTLDGWYRRANVNNSTQTPDPDLVDYAVKGSNVGSPGFYNASTAGNSDRAAGFLVNGQPGGLKKGSLGVIFTNETGSTIQSFEVSYAGEKWYKTVNDTTLKFQWIVTNSFAGIDSDIDLAGAPWNDVVALDWYVSADTASSWVNGTQAINATNFSATVTNNVNLADGQVLILRWRIPETGTPEHGLFIDDVVVTNFLTAPPLAGSSNVVFFGGDADVFDGDVEVNNQFVSQTDAGAIVQWNGVDSDGGSFGASGTVVDEGVGGALTNSASGLILTTVGITPVGSNTFASGSPNILGVTGGDNAKFNTGLGESWTFEFNKPVLLNQLVLTAMDGDGEIVRVTVDGVDTNSFTRLDSNMTNLQWEATANKYVYTYTSPIQIPAGTDITIDGTVGIWGLQGIVVEVVSSATGFDTFVTQYGLSGDPLADDDLDGLTDFGEYVFGGNPTNGVIDSVDPVFDVASGDYVYSLIGDDSLTAVVLTTDDLVGGIWVTNGTPLDVTSTSGELEAYTNAVGTVESQKFIRLKVEFQ